MAKVTVNRSTCEGYANCLRAAPAAFDLDEDDLVVLKLAEVGDDDLPRVRQAAYDCPTNSISVTEGEPPAAR